MVVLGALIALLAAGAAGGAIRYTIFTIRDGNYARLSGTNIDCQNGVSTAKLRTFFCEKWNFAGSGHEQVGAYDALINQAGVRVYRVTPQGNYTTVRQYLNKP